jgi:prepilin-type N-terminal cleavage/methylation domain-containing protein
MIKSPSVRNAGFTIVELLIVIVVIAILAAITIVAYNGIQNRAYDTSVQNDLRQLGARIGQHYVTNSDTLPSPNQAGVGSLGVKLARDAYGNHYSTGSNNYNALYCYSSTTGAYVLVANSRSGKTYVFRDGSVRESSTALGGSATTCSNNGISSASAYWLYGHGGTNVWVDWI